MKTDFVLPFQWVSFVSNQENGGFLFLHMSLFLIADCTELGTYIYYMPKPFPRDSLTTVDILQQRLFQDV
jgi:hypothetical protein